MPQADPDKARAADKIAVDLARRIGGSPDEHQQAAKQIAAGKLDQKAFLAGVDAATKRQQAGEQGSVDLTPRPTTALSVWVDKPDEKTGGSGSSSRALIVQAAMDGWNRSLGYEALKMASGPDSADVNVTSDMNPGSFFQGKSSGVGGQIHITDDPKDEAAWTRSVVMHELGHALGLSHTPQDQSQAGHIMGTQWPTGKIASPEAITAIGDIARDTYGIPVSDEAIHDLMTTHGGEGDSVEATFRQWAASAYEPYASQINAGVPPRALLDPYVQVASQELGRKVSLSDPTMQDALYTAETSSSSGGLQTIPSLSQFRANLRQTPEWDTGPKARQEADNLASRLSSMPIGESSGTP